MSVQDHLVHTHHCTTIPADTLKVWNSIAGDDPHIQIDQSNGVSAYVSYTADEAPALAHAILKGAGLGENEELAAARDRVREFVRQWRMMPSQHPTTVHSVYGDPNGSMADLLLADLDRLTR